MSQSLRLIRGLVRKYSKAHLVRLYPTRHTSDSCFSLFVYKCDGSLSPLLETLHVITGEAPVRKAKEPDALQFRLVVTMEVTSVLARENLVSLSVPARESLVGLSQES